MHELFISIGAIFGGALIAYGISFVVLYFIKRLYRVCEPNMVLFMGVLFGTLVGLFGLHHAVSVHTPGWLNWLLHLGGGAIGIILLLLACELIVRLPRLADNDSNASN
jgi:hypothetical protein